MIWSCRESAVVGGRGMDIPKSVKGLLDFLFAMWRFNSYEIYQLMFYFIYRFAFDLKGKQNFLLFQTPTKWCNISFQTHMIVSIWS
jgi:hypothetical protein